MMHVYMCVPEGAVAADHKLGIRMSSWLAAPGTSYAANAICALCRDMLEKNTNNSSLCPSPSASSLLLSLSLPPLFLSLSLSVSLCLFVCFCLCAYLCVFVFLSVCLSPLSLSFALFVSLALHVSVHSQPVHSQFTPVRAHSGIMAMSFCPLFGGPTRREGCRNNF